MCRAHDSDDNEVSRAATSIELGCADPEAPCKLPNAMAGDPALDQVVTRTSETGVRGGNATLTWNAGCPAPTSLSTTSCAGDPDARGDHHVMSTEVPKLEPC